MKESSFWGIVALVSAGLATLAMLSRDYLPTDPMIIEMLATLFGILIAITLGETFRSLRSEKMAKSVENDLVEELKEILEQAERPGISELHSVIWMSVKVNGIPDRIERV